MTGFEPKARLRGMGRSGGLLLAGLLLVMTTARAQPVEVAVRMDGQRVIVDVTAYAAARRAVAWRVMTDYEHMAEYVSNLKSSTVLSRRGGELMVEQAGEARFGPLKFAFSTVRAVELVGEREIRSRLVRGEFKSYEFMTRIEGDAGGPVKVVNHGEYEPTRWIPPMLGPAMIESEMRKQYGELVAEMLRREAKEAAAAPK